MRDRLCQLIRQHQLDANLVRSYAVDFCGTIRPSARPPANKSKALVTHLADWAEKDRNALLCQLNSYLNGTRKVQREALFRFSRPSRYSSSENWFQRLLFLVRVDRVRYRWHKQKPYYLEIRLAVLKPNAQVTGCLMTGQLSAHPCYLEGEVVPARLRLEAGAARGTRPSMTKPSSTCGAW